MSDVHEAWLAHPNGSIPKGAFCECCHRFNSRVVVVDVILRCQGKILLIRRAQAPDKGRWALPGGYLDWDETVQDGAVRELCEETGVQISVDILKQMPVISEPSRRQNVKVPFVADIDDFPDEMLFSESDEEVSDVRWWPMDDLPGLAFDHLAIITQGIRE